MSDKKTLLVVGAGGFIGGFICAEGMRRGYETWAGVRTSTSRRYLGMEGLHIVDFDYDNPEELEKQLKENAPEGGWDAIIFNLGVTKALRFTEFNRVNFGYLRTFTQALEDTGLMPRRFLYISSLSALGAGDEKNYTPMGPDMIPHPNTRYGLSKIKAETYLETHPEIPWTIFRPTGVYGPHEKDYLMMIQCIDRHFDFGVGFRTQQLTFIYVDDLVGAMFDALASDKTLKKKYIISEPKAYSQKEFRSIVSKELNRKFVIPITLPLWMGWLASAVAEKMSKITLKPSTLNRDKFKIMRQRNWKCTVDDAERDFGFKANVDLKEGIRRTVAAYLADKEANKKKK